MTNRQEKQLLAALVASRLEPLPCSDQPFQPDEARLDLRKLEFHDTPTPAACELAPEPFDFPVPRYLVRIHHISGCQIAALIAEASVASLGLAERSRFTGRRLIIGLISAG
jgi:hypothetical protein